MRSSLLRQEWRELPSPKRGDIKMLRSFCTSPSEINDFILERFLSWRRQSCENILDLFVESWIRIICSVTAKFQTAWVVTNHMWGVGKSISFIHEGGVNGISVQQQPKLSKSKAKLARCLKQVKSLLALSIQVPLGGSVYRSPQMLCTSSDVWLKVTWSVYTPYRPDLMLQVSFLRRDKGNSSRTAGNTIVADSHYTLKFSLRHASLLLHLITGNRIHSIVPWDQNRALDRVIISLARRRIT